MKNWAKGHWASRGRVHEFLPQTGENADVIEWLRQLAQAPALAGQKVSDHLKATLEGMDKRQRELFERGVFYRDFAEDAREGKKIPEYHYIPQFLEEVAHFEEKVLAKEENRIVKERLDARDVAVRKLAVELVAAELIPEEALERKSYITHRVLQYAESVDGARVPGYGSRVRMPKYLQRRGTEKAINTDYIQAEAYWMMAARVNLKTAEVLNKIRKSDHNRTTQLLDEVRARNKENFGNFLREEWAAALVGTQLSDQQRRILRDGDPYKTLSAAARIGRALASDRKRTDEGIAKLEAEAAEYPPLTPEIRLKMPQAEAWLNTNYDMGRAMANLRKWLKGEGKDLEGRPGWFAKAAADFVNQRPGEAGPGETSNFWKLIQYVASELAQGPDSAAPGAPEVTEGQIAARTALKAMAERKSIMRETLADDFLSTVDLNRTLEKISELNDDWVEYRAWQPDPGNVVFSIATLPERATQLLATEAERISKIVTEGLGEDSPHSQEIIVEIAQSVRNMHVRGGPKQQMVIQKGLGKTLDTFKDEFLYRQYSLFRNIVRVWKRIVLTYPERFLKYNLRNLFGDFDHVFAAYGFAPLKGILAPWKKGGENGMERPAGLAIRQLWDVAKGREPSRNYMKALELGVIDGGYTLHEVLDSSQSIDRALKQHQRGWKWVRKVWDFFPGATRFRENIFRLAVFNHVQQQIARVRRYAGIEGPPTPENVERVMWEVGYGGARREMVNNLADWTEVAAHVARETLGDYAALTKIGRELRDKHMPFYSWKEVNWKYYYRFWRNAYDVYKGDANEALKAQGRHAESPLREGDGVPHGDLRCFLLRSIPRSDTISGTTSCTETTRRN